MKFLLLLRFFAKLNETTLAYLSNACSESYADFYAFFWGEAKMIHPKNEKNACISSAPCRLKAISRGALRGDVTS